MTGVKRSEPDLQAIGGSSTPIRRGGEEAMEADEASPDKKRSKSMDTEENDDSDSSSTLSDSSSSELDPNSQTMLQMNELADELDEDSVKMADFLFARLGIRDRARDKEIGKIINKKMKKGFNKISETLEKVTKDAGKAVQIADEAIAVAQEAKKIAEEVRDETTKEISGIRDEVAQQGKQIMALLHQQPQQLPKNLPPYETPKLKTKPGDRYQCVCGEFHDLLKRTEMMRLNFVLGKKKDEQSDATLDSARAILNAYVPDAHYTLTQAPKAKFVAVHAASLVDVQALQALSESRWSELAGDGWWIREEAPVELRALQTRARTFVVEAKDSDPSLKSKIGYIEVKLGSIQKNGREVLPLCFIPSKKGDNWKKLYTVFAERVAEVDGFDWLGQYESEDSAFYRRWFEEAGLAELATDYVAYLSSKQGKGPHTHSGPASSAPSGSLSSN
jgi:hypothetical protein